MRLLQQLYKSILTILGCFIFFTISIAQNWEVNWLNKINPDNPNSNFQIGLSNSVYPLAIATPVGLFATGIISKNKKLQQQSFKLITSLAINTIVTQGLKYTINRNRPFEDYPTIIHPYNIENDPSFPSGHTSTAFNLAATMSIQYKKWYIVAPAFLWASSVGYSRLYLGEHYPTDVFAGATIGIASAYLNEWLHKKLFVKK